MKTIKTILIVFLFFIVGVASAKVGAYWINLLVVKPSDFENTHEIRIGENSPVYLTINLTKTLSDQQKALVPPGKATLSGTTSITTATIESFTITFQVNLTEDDGILNDPANYTYNLNVSNTTTINNTSNGTQFVNVSITQASPTIVLEGPSVMGQYCCHTSKCFKSSGL